LGNIKYGLGFLGFNDTSGCVFVGFGMDDDDGFSGVVST
jgi:hypothetical protein